LRHQPPSAGGWGWGARSRPPQTHLRPAPRPPLGGNTRRRSPPTARPRPAAPAPRDPRRRCRRPAAVSSGSLPGSSPCRAAVASTGAGPRRCAGSRRRRLPSPVSLTLALLPLHVRLLLLLPLRLQPQLRLLPCQDLLHLLLRLVDLKHGGEMGEASPAEPSRRRLTGHGRHGVLRHSPKPW